MVKKIVKGKQIFARKAQSATKADKQVVTDLMDTLREKNLLEELWQKGQAPWKIWE